MPSWMLDSNTGRQQHSLNTSASAIDDSSSVSGHIAAFHTVDHSILLVIGISESLSLLQSSLSELFHIRGGHRAATDWRAVRWVPWFLSFLFYPAPV